MDDFNLTLACFVQGWKAKTWIDETRKSIDSLQAKNMLGRPASGVEVDGIKLRPIEAQIYGELGPDAKKVYLSALMQQEIDRATVKGSFRVLVDNVVSNKCISVTETAGEDRKQQFDRYIEYGDFDGARAVVKSLDDIIFEKGRRYW